MLGLTMTPKSASAMATLAVVRRDHFRPVMGSPAVSYSSKNSISVRMSAVFFPPVCVRRRSGECVPSHILIEQLLAPTGYGVRIDAEECRNGTVAAVSQLDGLQTRKEAALLLVQQTVEQQNGGLQFIRRNLESGSISHQRNSAQSLSGADLIP